MRNPYTILGVSPDATLDEMKRAFRLRAKALHPDHRPAEEQRQANAEMNELLSAWAELSEGDGRKKPPEATRSEPKPNNDAPPRGHQRDGQQRSRVPHFGPPLTRRLPTTNWLHLSGTHAGALHIPAGETVVLDGSHHGPVFIESGGTFIVQGIQTGPVDAVGGTVRVRGSGSILGTLTVGSDRDITLRGPVSRLVVTSPKE